MEGGLRLRLLEADRRHVVGGQVHAGLGSSILGSSSSRAVLRGAEHERLVENTNTPQLGLEFLDTGGEVGRLVVEVSDADGGTLEDGSLGRLLVRGREGGAEAVVPLAELVAAALLGFNALAADVLAAALWLLAVGGGGRKVIILVELSPVLLLLDLARATTGGTSGVDEDGAGGGPCALVAIDEATPVTLGRGLGLRGAGADTRRVPEATTNDGGGALGIGARQGGRGEVGVGEMVKRTHGGVEDGGGDVGVGGDGGKGVEGVGRAGAAAAVARDVEELFRRRCTACGTVTLRRRGQGRGGDRLRVKLWNLGRDVQRVEGEVAGACSESEAIRARCQYHRFGHIPPASKQASKATGEAGSKQGGRGIPEHIRVRVLGKVLREEIELVLFHMLGGVHYWGRIGFTNGERCFIIRGKIGGKKIERESGKVGRESGDRGDVSSDGQIDRTNRGSGLTKIPR